LNAPLRGGHASSAKDISRGGSITVKVQASEKKF
jgi:hypothetical protein